MFNFCHSSLKFTVILFMLAGTNYTFGILGSESINNKILNYSRAAVVLAGIGTAFTKPKVNS